MKVNEKNIRDKQLGAVSTEWIIGTLFMLAALFTPINEGKSVTMMLIDSMKSQYSHQSYINSLP